MKIMTNSNDKLARIAMNKSLLKEFHNNENNRIVYLKDGDEFQIQIFNPYQYVIGVSFTFNSDSVDNSKMLVLKPGERVWLDRYLNENRKLKFWTYKVNNSEEVRKAIEKNGILNIYFYKEIEKNNYTVWYDNNTYIYNDNWKNPIDDLNGGIRYTNNCYANDNNISSVNSALSSIADTVTCSDINCSISTSNTAAYTSYSASISTIPSDINSCVNKNSSNRSLQTSKSIETGRIEKGGYSNQKFNNYYGDFEPYWFKNETIHILPESQKQVSSNDLTKKYCHNCGRKIKSDFKFCPNCGAKQE